MMNPFKPINPERNVERKLNPIRNVERAPGAGGPEGSLSLGLGSDPMRHKKHQYPVRRMTMVHIGIPHLAEGGDVEDEQDGSDQGGSPDAMDLREPDDQLSPHDEQLKSIVVEAMAALRGQHPDPEEAIRRFIEVFGEDDFRELQEMVLGQNQASDQEPDADDFGGPPDQDEDDTGSPPAGGAPPGGYQVGGLLRGPGSGQSDDIEATTPTGKKVLLSDGEYVVDAPTVAILGDGSTDAGARRLDKLRAAIRHQAYGHGDQAKAMKKGGRAALLNALNS